MGDYLIVALNSDDWLIKKKEETPEGRIFQTILSTHFDFDFI